jgi:spore coat polysaccharide biosynthesis predicted glycosyltransferase SpsG
MILNCINLVQSGKIDWVIIGHYGINEKWHKKLKPFCHRLMVIDDMAENRFQCDVLLNQNLGLPTA